MGPYLEAYQKQACGASAEGDLGKILRCPSQIGLAPKHDRLQVACVGADQTASPMIGAISQPETRETGLSDGRGGLGPKDKGYYDRNMASKPTVFLR